MSKKREILLGAHMSISGGLEKSIARAEALGCTTMQIFTKNNKSWFADKPITPEEAALFKTTLKKSSLSQIMAHTSYLINLGSANKLVEKKSIDSLKHELHHCEQLNIPYLVLHPGAHLGAGEEKCLAQISKNLDLVLTGPTKILLEATAGQGTCIGYKFEHLKFIYQNCTHKKHLGICIDTCHLFAAGYDLSTPAGYHKTIEQFDKIIGLNHLHAIHLNDCKSELGSRVDRHDNIGKGNIPLKTFELIMNDPRFTEIPKVLETPPIDGEDWYEHELTLLRKMVK